VSDDHATAAESSTPGTRTPPPPARDDDGTVVEASRSTSNKGMFVDPQQIPMSLMEPSMQAGQSAVPDLPIAVSQTPSPPPQTGTE
jgi:hypothetical protein